MKADEICERYASRRGDLVLKLLEADTTNGSSTLLIEGSPRSLRMLAELLLAVADGEEGDGFGISPFGAGSKHFSATSELGVYVHRHSK